jgi:radical SAM superfamily enzyme YgiQ (UPF0313 family)
MNVCLITAPITTEFADLEELTSRTVRRTAAEPQLGVLSLAAVLESHQHNPRILDLDVLYLNHASSRMSPCEFAEAAGDLISKTTAEVYGFSSICSSYPLTIRIAERVKTLRPSSTILFGGPQASVVDLQTLASFPFVDLILRGESEHSLLLLLNELQGSSILTAVPGLSYRVDGLPHRNPPSPVLADLDSLPMPAYHLTGTLQGAVSASLELGRGCPFACTFCSTNDFFRRNFRLRSPERVLNDMRSIASEYGIRSFVLVHDMFTVDRRKVIAFCDAMIASGEGFTWSCSARTDCVDEELLALMARAGCGSIFFGVEVGSVKMQKVIDKHLDPQRAEEIIDLAERLDIRTTVSLITGFPEETWDDVRDTMRIFMHSTRCPQSSPQLNILAPLAETPLYSKYKDDLTLNELCSDMSHQGRIQNPADEALIRRYPAIFPNFYLLPTPYLDRECLLELREFTLIGAGRFRWLLSALEQNTTGILNIFLEWRKLRLALHPALRGPELRQYYRMDSFRTELLEFVRKYPRAQVATIEALLDCEDALRRRKAKFATELPEGKTLAKRTPLRSSDVPARSKHAEVIELDCDIQQVVEGLKLCREPEWSYGPHYYITQETADELDRLVCVSPWMAAVLRACDGHRDAAAVVRHVSAKLTDVEGPLRDYVALQLLKGARTREYVAIYRNTAGTARDAARQAIGPRTPIPKHDRRSLSAAAD